MSAPLVAVDSAESRNRLGIAGFICSLLGIVTLGLLSPLALLLSAVALHKRPRGYAWAGTALGLVGTALLVAVVALGGIALVFLAFAGIFAAAAAQMAPLMGAADAIDKHMEVHGSLPAVAEGEALAAPFKDAWGHTLRYTLTGNVYQLTSLGPDNLLNTVDDIRFRGDGKDRRFITAGPDGRFDTTDDEVSDPIPAISPPVRK